MIPSDQGVLGARLRSDRQVDMICVLVDPVGGGRSPTSKSGSEGYEGVVSGGRAREEVDHFGHHHSSSKILDCFPMLKLTITDRRRRLGSGMITCG